MTLNRITILAIAGFASVAASALPAAAQTAGSDHRLAAVDARDDRQETRIANGVAAGQISPREAAGLDRQNARIDRSTARLAADGNFSRRDRAQIAARQERASAHIGRARHNRR